MAEIVLRLRPEGDVEVSLGSFLGSRFGAYRGACADAGAAAVKLANGSWVNRLPLASVPALLAGPRGFGLDVAPAVAEALRGEADRAAVVNGVGFSKFDGEFGHSLADQVRRHARLSDAQWCAAVALARKYKRQVGVAP